MFFRLYFRSRFEHSFKIKRLKNYKAQIIKEYQWPDGGWDYFSNQLVGLDKNEDEKS